jgi:hypothetical protein
MFGEFFRFELGYQLRQPLLWLIALVFALLAFGATSSDAVQVGGAVGNVYRNAPTVIISQLGVFTLLGLFLITIFIAGALLRDYELGTSELFFATPMRKADYLFGRITAGMLACLVIYLAVALGMIVGQFMPWVDPKRLGPFSLGPFLWSFAVIVLPNLLFGGALLALLAALTRSMMMVYVGILAFFVLWIIAGQVTADLDNVWIGALLDPFGVRAVGRFVRYWSAEERNTMLPELAGYILGNRALWAAIALALLAATHALFKPLREGTSGRGKKAAGAVAAPAAPVAPASVRVPAVERRFDRATALAQFWKQLRFDTVAVLKSVPFVVMLLFSVINFTGGARFIDAMFGTKVYPVTYLMLEALAGSSNLFLLLIVTFYAGELIWKERQAKLGEVTDAMPVPNWAPLAAKAGALIAVVAIFALAGMLAGMAFQAWRGYGNFEPGVYLQGLLIGGMPFVLLGLLALALQVFTNSKFIGYLAIIVLFVTQAVLGILNFDHNLYNYAGAPLAPYSDMNGWGHWLGGTFWFYGYWALAALALMLLASAFWVRGVAGSARERIAQARDRLSGPLGAALAATLLAFVAVGAYIFYNTNVLNEYVPGDEALDRQARYEREYRQYKDLAQPRILAVEADVDIRPERRAARIEGRYRLRNPHATPISELHVLLLPQITLEAIEFAPHELVRHDEELGYRIFKLQQPLAPGAEMDFRFTIAGEERGFGNGILQTQLIGNGSFFNSGVFPVFGYDENRQIVDRNERRKRELGEVPRMAKLEDEAARANTYISNDADWIDFKTTVCTAPDQIALAPGYLEREFERDGRRCFAYAMDRPMLPFFAYLSARWSVEKGEWNGIPIEVYFHNTHPYNVQRMIESARDSLEYFTTHFTPYQHRQVRIIEFPRYARFAQSFANTIPFSESIGFIADLRDTDRIDYVYYVTAHEVAHQWWAHQVIGAAVQGSTVLSESLAQYSALMVMEKKYGREKMRQFLEYELDRYLAGRGGELREEQPLYRVENQQYIHYNKGSLVFYRLREEIGEEALNRALKRFLVDKGYQQPPYTTSAELLDYIRAEAPADKQGVITDLFEKITFYDNRLLAAKARKREDGRYELTLEVSAAKKHSDGIGKETDVALDDWIEVGVFARAPGAKEREEQVLHLERRHVTAPKETITITVDAEPYDAGFDPYNKLIDRVPSDNRRRVELL